METLTDAELALLEGAKSELDWDAACDLVKKARGGGYPRDWFAKVLQSGLAKRVSARWGGTDEIRLIPLK